MSDIAFLANAKKSWSRVLDMESRVDGNTLAIATALWATLNVDRLIAIAERAATQDADNARRGNGVA